MMAVPGTGRGRRVPNKDLRRLVRKLRKQGYEVVHGSSHFQVKDKDGKTVASLPGTTSDHRALKNVRAELRRKGITI